MWKAYLNTPSTSELADLAIRLHSMSVNQAGLERNFSDLKIKKTHLRNRLRLPKIEKMAKVSMNRTPPRALMIDSIFRLEPTFVHHRKKKDLLKTAQNGRTMIKPKLGNFL